MYLHYWLKVKLTCFESCLSFISFSTNHDNCDAKYCVVHTLLLCTYAPALCCAHTACADWLKETHNSIFISIQCKTQRKKLKHDAECLCYHRFSYHPSLTITVHCALEKIRLHNLLHIYLFLKLLPMIVYNLTRQSHICFKPQTIKEAKEDLQKCEGEVTFTHTVKWNIRSESFGASSTLFLEVHVYICVHC